MHADLLVTYLPTGLQGIKGSASTCKKVAEVPTVSTPWHGASVERSSVSIHTLLSVTGGHSQPAAPPSLYLCTQPRAFPTDRATEKHEDVGPASETCRKKKNTTQLGGRA